MNAPDKIRLSRSSGGVKNTILKNWTSDFDKLASLLSEPPTGDKDGSYFCRGPVNETCKRANNNITEGSLIILDGDSHIVPETGEIVEGAPPPEQVHQVLLDLNIQHILYTSHSHGQKGDRYRALITLRRTLKNAEELKNCVNWVINKLHSSGVFLNSVSENYRWAQPWYFPRIRSSEAPFLFFEHEAGSPLSVIKCTKWAITVTSHDDDAVVSSVSPSRSAITTSPGSSIGKYNTAHGDVQSMLKFLTAHKYKLCGQTSINSEVAYRLVAPGSTSKAPGVILFKSTSGVWRVCSHHGENSDPLAKPDKSGKRLAHDAFDLFCILDHSGDLVAATTKLRPQKIKIKTFGGSNAENVTQGINALAAASPPQVYQRGGVLCRVAHMQQLGEIEGCSIPAGTAVIVTVGSSDLSLRLAAVADWQKLRKSDGETVWDNVDPPGKVAQGILSSQGEWHGIPFLKAVSETPILRPDGSIHDEVGYDPATNLYYEGGCPPLTVPVRISRREARKAARYLLKVFAEFPFVNDQIDKAVVLAYILTLIVRGQIKIAPLLGVSATTPGTGKGLLIEICNLIVRGRDAAIMPPVSGGGAEEETRKRITALLLQGVNSVNLDNWVTAIGGESLNGLLTANEWSDRVLGRSETVRLPNRVTWAATGNNLTVRGDMVRRTLLIQLDARHERPELRQFKVSNLTQYVLANRAKLLSAAFTILRAYNLAGCPNDDGLALGRFEDWWKAVCAPIIWIGLPDPCKSQDQLRKDDPEMSKLERLLDAWFSVFDDKPMSVAELVASVTNTGTGDKYLNDLRDALLECSNGERGFVNTRSLGWYLKHFSDRIVAQLQLQRAVGRSKVPKYRVTTVA